MKKNINIRNLIIVMLCITIILMGIGFAFLSIRLDEEKNTTDKFDVAITKVEAQTSIKGGLIDPTATKELLDDGRTVKFNFTLNNPKDELAFEITIKNTGNRPAKVIRLISSPDYVKDKKISALIAPVTISQTQVSNKELLPDESIKIKLLVTYNMTNEVKPMIVPYQLTVLATSND